MFFLSHWILTCESRVVIKKWHEVKSLKIHGKQRWEEEIHSKTYWLTLSLWHKQSNHLKAQVHRWPPPLSFPRVLWGNSNAMQENLMLSTLAWGLRMAWPGFLEPWLSLVSMMLEFANLVIRESETVWNSRICASGLFSLWETLTEDHLLRGPPITNEVGHFHCYLLPCFFNGGVGLYTGFSE